MISFEATTDFFPRGGYGVALFLVFFFFSFSFPFSFFPLFSSSFFTNLDSSFFRLSRYSGADLPTPENGAKFDNQATAADFPGFHNNSYGDPRSGQRSYGDPDDDEDEDEDDDDQDWMNRKSKITFEVEDEEDIDREVRIKKKACVSENEQKYIFF